MKRFYIILALILCTTLGKNNVVAKSSYQTPVPIPHDSLISSTLYAHSLLYSKPDTALLLANWVYEASLQQKDTIAIAKSLSVLGNINWAQSKYNLALKLHFSALSLYQNLQDSVGIIKSYHSIGSTYLNLKNFTNAKRYFYRAKSLNKYVNIHQYLVLNYLNMVDLFYEEKVLDSAIHYLNLAKSQPESQLSTNNLAEINYVLGVLNKDSLNYDLAKLYLEQSIHLANITHNKRRIGDTYTILGTIYFEENKLEEAIIICNRVLKIAKELNHEHLELRITKLLYQIELGRGNMMNAIVHILRYTELKDKIYAISIARQSAEFETVYELEKIEKENSILQLKQNINDGIIRYQIGFIILALIALSIAVYFLVIINKQRRSLKLALTLLEEKGRIVETQKIELEKQSIKTHALNKELTLLNKNLESRAYEIAREIEVKNKKMNKYAFMNAHKLRAPIASILGLINLFGKTLEPQDEKTMIRMLKESADKLDNVVYEIKDIIDE